MATAISFDNVTNATTATDGTGYFDVLMKTINLHIDEQYDKKRIKGPDYANVYLGAMQMALTQSQQFVLQEQLQAKQVDKLDEEIDLLQSQDSELLLNGTQDRSLKAAQEALYKRQEEGFDENRDQKLLEAQLNAWGLMFSSGLLTEKPDIISGDEVSDLYYTMRGITDPPPSANAGVDQSVETSTLVTLDGTGSTDVSTYLWSQLSGTAVTITNSTNSVASFTPTVAGTYVIQLTATDASAQTDVDTVTITVAAP